MLQETGNRNAVMGSQRVADDRKAQEEFIVWILRGLKKPGKSRSALARALGVHPSQVTKMLAKKRGIKGVEIAKICAYLEEKPPATVAVAFAPGDNDLVPVVSKAEAGTWIRAQTFDSMTLDEVYPKIPRVPLEDQFEGLSQFAVKVSGSSTNAILPSGTFAICVPYWEARDAARPQDLVVLESKRGDLIEVSIRRLHRKLGEWSMWMESSDPGFQERTALGLDVSKAKEPFLIDGSEVRFVGLVIWKTQPLYYHYL